MDMNEVSDTNCLPETDNVNDDETNCVPNETKSEVNYQDNSSDEIYEDKSPDEINPDDLSNEINEGDEKDIKSSAKLNFSDGVQIDITPEKNGGVLKKIIKEGEGEELPGHGDRVFVHYTGWLLGKELNEFDSNRKEEKFEFNLGRGLVIKGWDLGISTMKKGEVSLFICHPKYAYGERGYPPTIPPYAPLLFEVELYDWKPEDLSPKKDESILRKVLEKGESSIFPNEGSEVKVEIIQYLEDGVHKEEKDFILGEGCIANIPEGLEIALQKFCLNEKSIIYLRNKYADEIKKSSETSPSDTELKYELTLLHLEKAKNVWEMNTDEKLEKAKVSKEKGVNFFKIGLHKLALKQFRSIVTCLENEPGVSDETREERTALLLSGYLNIALCHQKLDNHLEVVKACDRVLAMDPNNEKALFRRGQAKAEMNDCEEALADFETLCTLKPDNKAAQNYVIVCQNKMKEQLSKDKGTYNKMFEIFVKQDEERLKNMKTETGVWESDETENTSEKDPKRLFLNDNGSALLDANVIELSNTVNGNLTFQL